MIIAVVNNNVVTDIETIDPSLYQQYAQNCQICIDVTNIAPQPQVGWTFNGNTLISNGTNVTIITKLAFRERFQTSELLALYEQIPSNPMLQIMLDNQMAATYVDLSRSDTISGVEYLVELGILTQARATTILTTPPVATELYLGTT